jgi:hypothetical protein
MFNFFLLIKNGKIKKKKIIIGIIIGVPLITSAIVIPIVFIKKDNDEENNDKKVIEEIIKILKNKELNEKTLILEGNSTGKIIENNKNKIIAKIKELINDSKLEEILIEVSIKNDVNISRIPQPIIVTIKKNKYSKKLEGENGLKVKRKINILETKINNIKTYLETQNNLNILLPKTNYDSDDRVLESIKVKLINNIEGISNSDSHLIIKKVGSSTVNEVAAHGQASTQYIITIGKHEFTLNLNQKKFSLEEQDKIEIIKTHLETSSNLNLVLPKTTYDNDVSILETIKVKLVNNINDISSSDSNLIIKKVGSSEVNEVATHGQAPTQYEISVGEHEFNLNLNQEEFSKEEKDKIETIKTHLETSGNLNLALPKTTYDIDNVILEAIKVKLVNNINDISSSDSNLIIKKVGSSEVNEVATHGQAPTQYEISVGEHEFNLNLNQEEFSKEEKDKIETIKTHLETSGNLNLALPKTTYDIDNVILEAIKVKLVNDIETISSGDSHLIVKKVGSSEVNEVAAHGQASTQYEISIGEHKFTLKLNQEEFSKQEQDKIEIIKTHLETSGNLNLVLPKMNYNVDFVNPDKVILSVIKLLITENIKVISNDDFYLIIKKEGSKKVNEVAAHGQASTQYIITIGKHEFTLNLNQKKFSLEEQDKIEIIKTHLETSGNLNLVLPKTNYDSDDSILKSIKVKLVNDINDISSSDSHLIVKKIGSSVVNEIATHDEAPTQYEISVGEHEFTLNLKQKKFSLEEQDKIETIKTHLETSGNLNLALPKTTYDNDVSILEAIKLKLVNSINDISSSDSHLIIKKVGSIEVNEVATHGQAPTQYIITIGEHEFNLNLNQEEFSEEEKIINIIKKYLKNADNLNIILPKNTYDNDVSILEAVRLKLINNIEGISSIDSHLIIKKVGSSEINEVAIHSQPPTQYEITIDDEDFTLNLNQEEFSEEEKINKIKTYLKTSSNSNIILPKTTYDNDVSILEAIKVKLVNDINDISSSDSNLIIKKVGSSEVTLVATHSEAPTQYIITIDDEDFTLNLNQEEFSKEEKNKIKIIKTHLETLGNLNLILPKTTYDIDNVILEAIKVKLVNDIDDISSSDSHLIIKKVGSNEVNEVAAHGQALTQYEISVGEHEFTLNLNQEEFSEEEKIINIIKKYLENVGNLNLALPKTTYDNDVSILEAIKVKLVNDINDISSSDSHLIIKKVGSSEVNEVTTHGQAPTQYIITIDGEDFTLKLNQEEFSEEEKDKIKIIKKYLETPSNLNLILPKTNHSGDVEILDAIKLKLVNDIEGISSDDSYLIIKKIGSSVVNSIAFYNEKATPYEITIGKHEFTLNLNKEKYTLLEKK